MYIFSCPILLLKSCEITECISYWQFYLQLIILRRLIRTVYIFNNIMILLQLYAISLLFLRASSQTCYWPSGIAASTFFPCEPSQPNSACCSTSDYCLSNGLCFDAGANNVLTRQTCTDQTWSDNACPKYCLQS